MGKILEVGKLGIPTNSPQDHCYAIILTICIKISRKILFIYYLHCFLFLLNGRIIERQVIAYSGTPIIIKNYIQFNYEFSPTLGFKPESCSFISDQNVLPFSIFSVSTYNTYTTNNQL